MTDAAKLAPLAFYGGPWMSFLPFAIFVAAIVVTTFVWGSISDGALWLPAFLALVVPFFLARDKRAYTEALIGGMASREAIAPVVCWLFAGVFSALLRASGLAGAIAGLAAGAGVGATPFLLVAFAASALFATASGTGFGTIAAGMGVIYPAGVALGCDPALLAGAIISGAVLGDNLAPVSDTTICSALSQGVDVPGVVRSRLKYAAVAAAITCVAFVILGTHLNGAPAQGAAAQGFDGLALLMLVPVLLTVAAAVRTGDIVVATTVGIVCGAVVGVACGQFEVFSTAPGANALVTLTGEGLDRAVGGILYNGLSGMVQACVLALLLFGSTAVMRAGGGDERLLQALGKVARTPRSTEFVISAMVVALSCIMGLNAPAILAVGASFAKPLAQAQGISPYRTANLLDAMSNTLVYALPWTPAVVFTMGFAVETSAPLSALQITPFVVYGYALLVVMVASILLGVGLHDGEKTVAAGESPCTSGEKAPQACK